jgi:oligopeptide/dipeptide ABC transporter ATP-binding protein
MMLKVQSLQTQFSMDEGPLLAVDDVSFSMESGETLGLVGESGSGKSVTSFSILRLIAPPGKIVGGQILWNGKDLLKLSDREMRRIRGREISMIFQDPMSSLNPVFSVGFQLEEVLKLHLELTSSEAKTSAIQWLGKMQIKNPEAVYSKYPHELSGGMQQRVMIAMALCAKPKLLIADEPTTALDVSVQSQILNLLKELIQTEKMSLLLISHDMGVVAQLCNRMMVMYAGKIVESGTREKMFKNPEHPYTRGLIQSIPKIDGELKKKLFNIPGQVPNLSQAFKGCRFQPRCSVAIDRCTLEDPSKAKPDLACWNPQKGSFQ